MLLLGKKKTLCEYMDMKKKTKKEEDTCMHTGNYKDKVPRKKMDEECARRVTSDGHRAY